MHNNGYFQISHHEPSQLDHPEPFEEEKEISSNRRHKKAAKTSIKSSSKNLKEDKDAIKLVLEKTIVRLLNMIKQDLLPKTDKKLINVISNEIKNLKISSKIDEGCKDIISELEKEKSLEYQIVEILECSNLIEIHSKSIVYAENLEEYLIQAQENDFCYMMQKWYVKNSGKFIKLEDFER